MAETEASRTETDRATGGGAATEAGMFRTRPGGVRGPRRTRPEGSGDAGRRSTGRPNRWKVAFVTVLVLSVLSTATWVLLGSRLLVVRHVEVSGNRMVPRDRLVDVARIRLGLPMARLDTDAVRGRVRAVQEVESASVQRRWPATVRIVVRERVPIAVVERGGRFYQLDWQGVTVLSTPARPRGLPALSVTAPGPADPATIAALRVVHGLPAWLGRRLMAAEAPSPEAVTLRFDRALTVVWGPAERADEKIRLIQALRSTPTGRSARSIDVSSPEVVTTQ